METKQTAVQWLIEHIKLDAMHEAKTMDEWVKVFNQAKAMHEEQIRDAYCKGVNDAEGHPEGHKINWEEYYNETYGIQESTRQSNN